MDILKVKDNLDSLSIKKNKTPDLSQRALFIARSGQGKSNLIVNLLLRKEADFYREDFDAENIYIMSPSVHSDDKLKMLVKAKKIPESNIFESYDPEVLSLIYENIKEEYNEAIEEKEKPKHSLIIIDDCADKLKDGGRSNPLSKLYIAGRHYLISIFTTSQYYTAVPPIVRHNTNVIYIWNSSHKELVKIAEEHAGVKNEEFVALFKTLKHDHEFILIDYTKPITERIKNHKFLTF